MSKDTSLTTKASIEVSRRIQLALASIKKKSDKELPFMQVKS